MSEQESRILWQAKYNVLDSLRYHLTKCLEPRRHYAYLRSKGILSFDDQERIEHTCVTTSERAGKLLDILLTKGPNAFDELYNSIKCEGTQSFLLQDLNKSFEEQIEEIRRLQRRIVPNNDLLSDDDLPGPKTVK